MIKQQLRRVAKSNKGFADHYIAVSVTILIVVMLILITFAAFDGIQKYSRLNSFGDEMIKVAANTGKTTGDELNNRYRQLSENTKLAPDIKWNANYFDSSKSEVQYGDNIHLDLEAQIEIAAFGDLKIPLTITVKKDAQSMQYWK